MQIWLLCEAIRLVGKSLGASKIQVNLGLFSPCRQAHVDALKAYSH